MVIEVWAKPLFLTALYGDILENGRAFWLPLLVCIVRYFLMAVKKMGSKAIVVTDLIAGMLIGIQFVLGEERYKN